MWLLSKNTWNYNFCTYIFTIIIVSDVYDCSGVICRNGGTCIDGVNTYSCKCMTGYTGQHCEISKISSFTYPSIILEVPNVLSSFPYTLSIVCGRFAECSITIQFCKAEHTRNTTLASKCYSDIIEIFVWKIHPIKLRVWHYSLITYREQ